MVITICNSIYFFVPSPWPLCLISLLNICYFLYFSFPSFLPYIFFSPLFLSLFPLYFLSISKRSQNGHENTPPPEYRNLCIPEKSLFVGKFIAKGLDIVIRFSVFLYQEDDKLVITDIDGTISQSDVKVRCPPICLFVCLSIYRIYK